MELSRGSVILFFAVWILLVGALNIQAVLWHYGYFQREAGGKVGLPELALRGLGRGGLDLIRFLEENRRNDTPLFRAAANFSVWNNSIHQTVQDDGFSWRQCGSEKDPLQLSSLSILPSLFVIPGNLTLSLSAKVVTVVSDRIAMNRSLRLALVLGMTQAESCPTSRTRFKEELRD
ncbi:unnamed protein product [Darwinula stevensoni]|uniref:Uncharacterized protein n=1 Tax=Darwinula stevensoni TaxID=69355 RepID=A0A7R9A352_9CRUS|nr:unnamed protein product [Darwinula stevensoni]CAG0881393.1 unnamed protein product [Darwinula stevensoni]